MHHAPAWADEAAAQKKTAIIITAQNCFTALPGSGRMLDTGYWIKCKKRCTHYRG
jgi:hypothetical protein